MSLYNQLQVGLSPALAGDVANRIKNIEYIAGRIETATTKAKRTELEEDLNFQIERIRSAYAQN